MRLSDIYGISFNQLDPRLFLVDVCSPFSSSSKRQSVWTGEALGLTLGSLPHQTVCTPKTPSRVHPVPLHRTSGIIFKGRLAKLRVNPWYLVDVILMIGLYSVSMSPMY